MVITSYKSSVVFMLIGVLSSYSSTALFLLDEIMSTEQFMICINPEHRNRILSLAERGQYWGVLLALAPEIVFSTDRLIAEVLVKVAEHGHRFIMESNVVFQELHKGKLIVACAFWAAITAHNYVMAQVITNQFEGVFSPFESYLTYRHRLTPEQIYGAFLCLEKHIDFLCVESWYGKDVNHYKEPLNRFYSQLLRVQQERGATNDLQKKRDKVLKELIVAAYSAAAGSSLYSQRPGGDTHTPLHEAAVKKIDAWRRALPILCQHIRAIEELIWREFVGVSIR